MIVEVDTSLFPIIILKTLPVEVSDSDLEEHLAQFEKLLLEVPEKVIIIHDINKARFLSGDQMGRIRNWSIKNHALFQEKTLGSCIVSSSILSTLIIKAIGLLLKSSFTSEIFSSMEAAVSWAKKRLNEK